MKLAIQLTGEKNGVYVFEGKTFCAGPNARVGALFCKLTFIVDNSAGTEYSDQGVFDQGYYKEVKEKCDQSKESENG